ncbi:hypothetical protein TSAR_001584 [Trichomalopsis sarcophagae]|uniref:Uncharacterized protein n=1 Tax=Trichomalopsis sarcophagae TaxID=543379 RepID=A0A232ETX9_9HYME|nr:hypothetical protein TSAR_001584 [Trichomalopsis sarcophagae]
MEVIGVSPKIAPSGFLRRDRLAMIEEGPDDVSKALTVAKSRTLGLGGISMKYLSIIRPYILQPLCEIFNKSINIGTFPSFWKIHSLLQYPRYPC